MYTENFMAVVQHMEGEPKGACHCGLVLGAYDVGREQPLLTFQTANGEAS